ncbi:MAG: HAMP domain-containing histidine kinase [Candidatus Gastranaerophilales bacterium]|nr:HAMP domain-containing histidine kinase [Candidatus Gastranaerophilales bacterium]MCM1072176.1 HAMP domain-containing histidine kinase [Bacteroides sp.]
MSVAKDLLFIIVLLILFFVLRKNISLKSELFNQRENFIKTLSHDLRVSTLAQIRGLDLLKNKYNIELISDVEESCKYSLDMINMLLSTYRYDNGEQVLNREIFNFSDSVSTCSSKLCNITEEKGIRFYYSMNSSEPIWADKTEIEKVLYYLLSTAVFYSEKNNTIAISSQKAGGDLEVTVTYSGKPLSDEECRRMFSNNPRFSTVGHGIKMYMCKKIIEFHGGTIGVNNLQGKINSFTFTIPEKKNASMLNYSRLGYKKFIIYCK